MSIDLQDLSRRLFKTAEQLWTNTALRPDQYAQPVLALIALRQMAGSDMELARLFGVGVAVHPRVCGERWHVHGWHCRLGGSSPRVRGTRPDGWR